MTQSNELAIDFGSIVGAPAEPPAGSADNALSAAVARIEPAQLVCADLLTPAQRDQAKALASQLYPQLLASTDQLAQFGSAAIDQVNVQVQRIFSEVGQVNIPELTSIMHQINDRMREFRHKYNPSDPAVRELFDKWMDAIKGVFRRGRDMVQMLFEEARSVEQQLDRIAGTLADKQAQLRRNVVLCDELYKANEAAISQLIGVIAVMEMVRALALDDARGIRINDGDVDRQEKQERLARITEFIQNIEVRISEYQQRLFVAWSTSPQVRNIRLLHYGLGQRLALLVNLTIPTMKLTIAQWGLLMQANQAAQMQQAVAEGANEVLSAYASSSATTVPRIAKLIQTPTLLPQTILEVADSIDAQAKGIEDAVRYGQKARAEVESAIVAAQVSMSGSTEKLSRNVVELVARARKPLELPAAPSVPESVLENADALLPQQGSTG